MCLVVKTGELGKFHSGMNYSAAGLEFNVLNQQYILNKVSFTETHSKQSYVLSS